LRHFYPAEKKQRTLIERFLLSVSAYALCVLIAWIAKFVGMTSLSSTTLLLGSITILIYLIGVYFIYRSGLNNRFADSQLTRLQMLVAIGWITLFIGSTSELRGAMLMIYLFVAMFSLFTLNPWQTAGMGLSISVIYGLVIAVEAWNAEPGFHLTAAIIEWGMLSVSLAWLLAITSYMSSVRERVKRANHMIMAPSAEIQRSNEQLEAALGRVKQLVATDELTGLSNRRHFVDTAQSHIQKCHGERFGFGLCVIDLDKFKQINDRYGHLVGDEVLRRVAAVMHQHTREYDLLARFGGEEFTLIVTRGDVAITRRCAERLRHAVANTEVEISTLPLKLTVSIGATVFRSGDSLESALARADAAMYQAKRAGRNAVVMNSVEKSIKQG
jgi:diguanylate cyclase (GGDEF)-like protein